MGIELEIEVLSSSFGVLRYTIVQATQYRLSRDYLLK